jgi:hypothetical protein
MKYVIDRFGEDVYTKPKDEDKFIAIIEVALSPNFYAWVFRFGGDMRIVSPKKAVNEIVRMAKELVKQELK